MPGDPASPLLWNTNGDQPDERSLPAWCAYTGQSAEAARNWGWLNVLHPDDRANIRNAWKDLSCTPHPDTLTCRLYNFRQGYLPMRILRIPLFNETHQVQGWFIFTAEESANPPTLDENWEIKLIYGMIFAQTMLGVFCLSLDGSILHTNQRFCQLTGYTEKDLLRMTLWQLSTPEYIRAHLEAMHERLASGQNAQPFRTRYQRKDSTFTWVRVTQFLVCQPGGEPYYYFFTVEDANEQVQIETERAELLTRLQEAHNEALGRTLQLEAVFEALTDGILVSDRYGNIIKSNAATNRLLQLDSHPYFLDMPLAERLKLLKGIDQRGEIVPPDQWPLARVLRGEALQGGRADDIHLTLPDDTAIYVNHTGACIRDEHNQITGAVIVIHDVNERHLLENRIHKAFGILLALAEELVDMPKRNFQEASHVQEHISTPAYPLQTASEYLTELTCQMLEYRSVAISLFDPATNAMRLIALAGVPAEEKASYIKTIAEIVSFEHLPDRTMTLLRGNEVAIEDRGAGSQAVHPSKLLLAPMMLEGCLAGVLTVEKTESNVAYTREEFSLVKAVAKLILLVIERERIQREWIESHTSELALREANRRFDEFLSIASHELRTPLAGIKGNLQLALRRLNALQSDQKPAIDQLFEKLSKIQDYLLQAEHRVNVQNRMISDLLDVSRIQANKLELVLGPCDLLQVVYEAVKDQQYNVPERVITLKIENMNPILVVGDADRLGQVIHNYLTNALKYSLQDRPITVSMSRTSCEVRVSVHDQGPGLTPEQQQHVWERFYRVKGIPAQGEGGSQGLGLGLHICRTIIQAHQGKWGLESTPGKGSTFWFTLPLAQPPSPVSDHLPYVLSEQLSESEASHNGSND